MKIETLPGTDCLSPDSNRTNPSRLDWLSANHAHPVNDGLARLPVDPGLDFESLLEEKEDGTEGEVLGVVEEEMRDSA